MLTYTFSLCVNNSSSSHDDKDMFMCTSSGDFAIEVLTQVLRVSRKSLYRSKFSKWICLLAILTATFAASTQLWFFALFFKGVSCDVTDMQLISFSLASLLPLDRYQFQLIWKALNSHDWSIFFRSKIVFWIFRSAFFSWCLKALFLSLSISRFLLPYLLNVHCNIWKSYQSHILRGSLNIHKHFFGVI